MIVVALTALAYTFFSSMFTTITETGETSIAQIEKTLSSCMKIDGISHNKIYLRNCGQGLIINDTINIYIDDEKLDFFMTPASINYGDIATISLDIWGLSIGDHKLLISNPQTELIKTLESILPDSCVLSLDFDEGSGIVAYDKSGYRNDGTIYGAQWVSGRYGNALEFDGINDYISISDSDSLDLTENFTIGVVLNIKSIGGMGGSGYILSKAGNYELSIGGGEMGPCIRGSVGLNSGMSDGLQILGGLINKSYIVFKHNFLQTGTDVSISSDFNTDVVIFEIDTAHSSASNNPLLIGYDGTSNWLNATIDSIRIFNKALTLDETVILRLK
jgi:hypothetical protein